MSEIIILGAGGHAREVLGIVDDMIRAGAVRWTVRGLVDDDEELHGRLVDGRRVLGGLGLLAGLLAGGSSAEWPVAVCGVGSPAARRRMVLRLADLGLQYATVISPTASVSPFASMGQGCVIFPGAVIGPGAVLGDHVVVNAGATVSHESVLGDFAALAPGVHLAGNTVAGEGCDVGIGAVTVQGVRLGAWSVVGAGSVVVQDLPANVTAVGVPASIIKTREDGWHER